MSYEAPVRPAAESKPSLSGKAAGESVGAIAKDMEIGARNTAYKSVVRSVV
jgi:hypothetical protein